jgi:hypothetical protein
VRNPLNIEVFGNGRDLPGPHFENSTPVGATKKSPSYRRFSSGGFFAWALRGPDAFRGPTFGATIISNRGSSRHWVARDPVPGDAALRSRHGGAQRAA